jgi:hypothetical protein
MSGGFYLESSAPGETRPTEITIFDDRPPSSASSSDSDSDDPPVLAGHRPHFFEHFEPGNPVPVDLSAPQSPPPLDHPYFYEHYDDNHRQPIAYTFPQNLARHLPSGQVDRFNSIGKPDFTYIEVFEGDDPRPVEILIESPSDGSEEESDASESSMEESEPETETQPIPVPEEEEEEAKEEPGPLTESAPPAGSAICGQSGQISAHETAARVPESSHEVPAEPAPEPVLLAREKIEDPTISLSNRPECRFVVEDPAWGLVRFILEVCAADVLEDGWSFGQGAVELVPRNDAENVYCPTEICLIKVWPRDAITKKRRRMNKDKMENFEQSLKKYARENNLDHKGYKPENGEWILGADNLAVFPIEAPCR